MPDLNGYLFLLILITGLFLLGAIAVVRASLCRRIRFLRAAPARMGLWIMPGVDMVPASRGIAARRHRYRKFPSPSFPPVGLDWMNRETEKAKWKPKAGK